MFGTMADFDELMADAKAKDIKVIIDQVLSHTSDQHPWFLESRESRDNPIKLIGMCGQMLTKTAHRRTTGCRFLVV